MAEPDQPGVIQHSETIAYDIKGRLNFHKEFFQMSQRLADPGTSVYASHDNVRQPAMKGAASPLRHLYQRVCCVHGTPRRNKARSFSRSLYSARRRKYIYAHPLRTYHPPSFPAARRKLDIEATCPSGRSGLARRRPERSLLVYWKITQPLMVSQQIRET